MQKTELFVLKLRIFASAVRVSIYSLGIENTKMTGRPPDLSINKRTQTQSLVVPCACHLLARSTESPQNCAPTNNWERLCCSLTTEATRGQSNPDLKAKLPQAGYIYPRWGSHSPPRAKKRRENPRRGTNVIY